MKKLTLLLLVIPSMAFSQDIDSLRKDLMILKRQNEKIILNLDKGHTQYRKGTAAIMSGTGLFLGGAAIINDKTALRKDFPELIYFCAAITSVGIVLQIDSRKYHKRKRLQLN